MNELLVDILTLEQHLGQSLYRRDAWYFLYSPVVQSFYLR